MLAKPRLLIILSATILSIFAILTPLTATYYLSWTRTTDLEKKRLSDIMQVMSKRILFAYTNAEESLLLLSQTKGMTPCSPEHIRLMRNTTYNNPFIEEIGYYQNNIQLCGTWGNLGKEALNFTDEITIKSGVKVSLNARSTINKNNRMISLRYDSYYALVNPMHFSNLILDPKIKIGIFSEEGALIASMNNPDLTFMESYFVTKQKPISSQYIVEVSSPGPVVILITEPKSHFYNTLSKQQLALFPLGILAALPLIGLIIYYSRRRLSIDGELKYAVENDKLTVYYQPIIDLETERCIGAEALIRWFTDKGEMISPDLFIPIAEKTGLASKISKFVIHQVIKDMKKALLSDKNLHFSINLTAHDFDNTDIINFLESTVQNSGIARNQIWLEITERRFVENKDTIAMISRIRASGYQFAMDDFGTGYSNLSTIKNISLDVLKIDKSFIDTVGMNTVTSGITEHIINIAKHLNLKIVAEGIEKPNQRDYLREKKVEYGQGWLYAKAMNKDDFLNYYHHSQK